VLGGDVGFFSRWRGRPDAAPLGINDGRRIADSND